MFFSSVQLEPLLQLFLASAMGSLIGFEREQKRKEAGFRTFILVAFGACFFTVTAVYFNTAVSADFGWQIDPARVIQAVAIGIGFIGSGLIIQRKAQIEGLTTAAALWAVAAIGIGVGLGLYFISIVGTFLVTGILALSRFAEKKLF